MCGGNLETSSTVCKDVLVKYKHEASSQQLDFTDAGVNRNICGLAGVVCKRRKISPEYNTGATFRLGASLQRRRAFSDEIYERQRAKLNDPWGDAVAAKLTARQITEAQTARIRFCTVTLAQNVDRGCCQDKRSHASKRDKR